MNSEHLRAVGVARDPDNPQMLFLAFNRPPSDDEMRAVHDFLRRPPARCPFCSTPTYGLPCTSCGEPDVPEACEAGERP